MSNRFKQRLQHTASIALSITSLCLVTPALSAPTPMHGMGHAQGDPIGVPGKPATATRTVEVVMADNYFEPEKLLVTPGETVRFLVRNEGSVVHEFNIASAAMHRDAQGTMRMMLEHGAIEVDKINRERMKMDMGGGHVMDYDKPNAVLLEPGKSAEITWTFSGSERLEFACNMPGHYESGMVGQITLQQ